MLDHGMVPHFCHVQYFKEFFDQSLFFEELVYTRGIGKSQSRASLHIIDDVLAMNDYNNQG